MSLAFEPMLTPPSSAITAPDTKDKEICLIRTENQSLSKKSQLLDNKLIINSNLISIIIYLTPNRFSYNKKKKILYVSQ